MTARTDFTRTDLLRGAGGGVLFRAGAPGWWTVLAGVAMVVFLGLRPWGDKTGEASAAVEAFASVWWPVSHLLGAGVFVFLTARTVALLHRYPGRRAGVVGVVLTGVGAVGVVSYYGMEALALHGLATAGAGMDPAAVVATAQALRTGGFAVGLFSAGLLLVTVGVAISGTPGAVSGARWRHAVLVLAVAAILPHFFLPPTGRLIFGVLFLAACLLDATTARTRHR